VSDPGAVKELRKAETKREIGAPVTPLIPHWCYLHPVMNWLRRGCVDLPLLATPCNLSAINPQEMALFRVPGTTLNLRVEGSIPSRLTSLRS
jgi:hypothetical protein